MLQQHKIEQVLRRHGVRDYEDEAKAPPRPKDRVDAIISDIKTLAQPDPLPPNVVRLFP